MDDHWGQMHNTDSWNSLPNLSLFAFKSRSEVSLPVTFSLQMPTGCQEWMCIKWNSFSTGGI